MMKYHDSVPRTDRLRRRERGFTLLETLAVIMIIAMVVAVGYPMMRRAQVRAEMMGQVKMLQNAIAISRMRAIKDGQWVVLELLKNESGTLWTAPLGRVFAWVDTDRDRRMDNNEELVNEWYLNRYTMILKEGGDRRLFDLRSGYKGIVFLPTGVCIATKKTVGGIPGIGRGSVIVEDQFGNQIRLQVWSSTGAVDLTMWTPGWTGPEAEGWDANLRHWQY